MDPSDSDQKLNFIKNGTIHVNTSPLKIKMKKPLKNHQICMIHAMKQLENNSDIQLSSGDHMETHVGICGDDVGAGKSISMLGLINENNIVPEKKRYTYTDNLVNVINASDKSNFYPYNVIVVPHNITKQWEQYVHIFTTMKSLVINRKNTIIHAKYIKKQHPGTQIIIVSSTMYNDFAILNSKVTWSRLVFDEADTISIPNCQYMKTRFLWYITSSLENVMFPLGYYYASHVEYHVKRYYVAGIRRNGFIRDTVRSISSMHTEIQEKIILKNNPEYVKMSFDLEEPERTYVKCKSPIYMNIIADHANDTNLIDMLNAGNVSGFIERMGCNCETTANVISAVTSDIQTKITNLDHEIRFVSSIHMSNNERENKLKTLNERKQSLSNRLKSIQNELQNYKDQVCPICFDTYKTPVSTLKCCNNIFCTECLIQWKAGTCPMCREPITASSLVMIDDDAASECKKSQLKQKLETLVDMVSRAKDKKYLIFAGYDNTFHGIINEFILNGISHNKVSGNSTVIEKTIDKFRNGQLTALLLNPNYYGCGMNLECTTDIIFYHKFSKDIERQIIGRAQRHGRKSRLKIHYLYYEHEFKN